MQMRLPLDLPPRALIKRAHVCDAGEGQDGFPYGAMFKCARCMWESDWICFDNTAEIRRGLPCPTCNLTEEI